MNTVTVFLLFVGFVVASASLQNDTEQQKISYEIEIQREVKYEERTSERRTRQKRATCDLLSVDTKLGSLNHSACAAHCLALRKGFKGGRCIDGVCNCRR